MQENLIPSTSREYLNPKIRLLTKSAKNAAVELWVVCAQGFHIHLKYIVSFLDDFEVFSVGK